jgi:2-(1,2-epoxy-1,2-dihydrophenyl)acetyl-CoA isomerase
MWIGDTIHAKEAERIGLVRCIVPPENLMNEVREFALRLARGPSVAIEMMKRMVYDGLKANDFSSQLSHEDFVHYVTRLTEDYEEGTNSFIARRGHKALPVPGQGGDLCPCAGGAQ